MIGIMKATKDVFCEICSHKIIRKMSQGVKENTKEEKEKAKKLLIDRLNKKYICKICKSILNKTVKTREALERASLI